MAAGPPCGRYHLTAWSDQLSAEHVFSPLLGVSATPSPCPLCSDSLGCAGEVGGGPPFGGCISQAHCLRLPSGLAMGDTGETLEGGSKSPTATPPLGSCSPLGDPSPRTLVSPPSPSALLAQGWLPSLVLWEISGVLHHPLGFPAFPAWCKKCPAINSSCLYTCLVVCLSLFFLFSSGF